MEEKKEKTEVAEREEKVLDFWNGKKIFQKTLEKDSPKGEFVFYEGPPTANAKPALHHLVSRVFKDIIPRYKTMQGFHVRRKAGWDTHGLPVELQIEKKLGLTSKKDIEGYGVEKFNKECKESVFEYIQEWEKFTERIGYWVDKKTAYYTFDTAYMESVWNILKTVDERGLLYKDYKVLPWCPRCGTALSSHELAQGYQDDKDLSVTAKFKVYSADEKFSKVLGKNPETQEESSNSSVYILAWTTTPWTLPGNVALAVGEDIDYVKIRSGDSILILAKERLSIITDPYEILQEMKGSELVGLKYEPLYNFLQNKFTEKNPEAFAKSYEVYAADFVTTTDGTGVVHTAVMYGQEDFELGTRIGLPKFHLVKEDGHFLSGMDFLSDRFVKDEEVAIDIIKDLAHRGLLFKKEKYEHSYPHCWRCKTALIYYARDSWYIKMSSLRDELVRENDEINWEPSHIKNGRFGEWLKEIKDWAVSRERYWGTPLPIWEKENGEKIVIGSVEELKNHVKKSGNTYFGIRHGEAENNVLGIWSSKTEDRHSLTVKGLEQVNSSITKLKDKKIDLILSSPILRTRETAEAIAESLGIDKDKIVFDDRLTEWQVGEFNGQSMGHYFKKRREDGNPYTYTCEGGESYRSIVKRSGEVLYELEKTHQDKNILIVTHGGVLRALSMVAHGVSEQNEAKLRSEFNDHDYAEIREIPFIPLSHNEYFEVDLHKPYIDSLELVDDGGEPMKRVKEVMDVWFDSGSMPFAQDHYPFNGDKLVYPADFISEAIDQTRGWFYTLHAIGILLGKGKAYKNVICLGHILDKEGKKMSKSIGNILDPWELMDRYGVDALRLWMYTVNSPGDSKNFDEKTVDEIIKKVFNPIINISAFFEMYKDDSIVPHDKSENVLDRWILSRLNQLIHEGTQNLDNFKVFESARSIKDFVNDFSTWYIRRSRERFKSEDAKEKSDALGTTSFVLLELLKYMAPFTPFFTEEVYQRMRGEGSPESVHLLAWPRAGILDEALLKEMEIVRGVVSSALELRQKAGHKVRQPLALLTIPNQLSIDLLDIIADEINVKEVRVQTGSSVHLDTVVTQELKEEGVARDMIRGIQDARKRENLSPMEKINLHVKAPEDVRKIIEVYNTMIKLPTQVTSITYSDTAQTHIVALELGEVSLSIEK